jgi:hypothetical protein
MKTFLKLGLVLVIVSLSNASVDRFTLRSDWERRVTKPYQEEFFTDTTLNAGVSVISNNGFIDTVNSCWHDQVIPEETITTWVFAQPIVAYGAYWDLAGPGGPGANIQLYLNGTPVGSEISSTYSGGFFGVVSTSAFNQVLITAGSNAPPAWCEEYTMRNMVYVPEPATILVIGLGAMLMKKKR